MGEAPQGNQHEIQVEAETIKSWAYIQAKDQDREKPTREEYQDSFEIHEGFEAKRRFRMSVVNRDIDEAKRVRDEGIIDEESINSDVEVLLTKMLWEVSPTSELLTWAKEFDKMDFLRDGDRRTQLLENYITQILSFDRPKEAELLKKEFSLNDVEIKEAVIDEFRNLRTFKAVGVKPTDNFPHMARFFTYFPEYGDEYIHIIEESSLQDDVKRRLLEMAEKTDF